eukprot:1551664-Prymnesium_polylepis.2
MALMVVGCGREYVPWPRPISSACSTSVSKPARIRRGVRDDVDADDSMSAAAAVSSHGGENKSTRCLCGSNSGHLRKVHPGFAHSLNASEHKRLSSRRAASCSSWSPNDLHAVELSPRSLIDGAL